MQFIEFLHVHRVGVGGGGGFMRKRRPKRVIRTGSFHLFKQRNNTLIKNWQDKWV